MAGELASYLQDASALLHDYNNVFTPVAQLTRWVNTARSQLAKRSGCIERLITGQSGFGASAQPGVAKPGGMQPGALPGAFAAGTVTGAAVNTLQTIPGQERYPFQGFFNNYASQQYSGVKGVVDAASISVNWGGAVRPSLAWLAWEDFQAFCRAYSTPVTSFPYYWTVFNPGENGEIWLFPAPSTAGDIELDAYCSPTPLLGQSTDVEAIPQEFQDLIKYGAAELAFASTYRYQEAQMMQQMFTERFGVDTVARDRGKVAQFYQPSF